MSYIICVIWEVDFMEDLGAVLLDGFHFYQMGRKLPGLLTEGTKHSDQCIAHTHRSHTQNHSSVLFCFTGKAALCIN